MGLHHSLQILKNFAKSFKVCLMQDMQLKVLTRTIRLKIGSFFCWQSSPFFSRPWCETQGRYCKEKLQVEGLIFSMFIWERCASLCPKFNRLWQLSTISITRPAPNSSVPGHCSNNLRSRCAYCHWCRHLWFPTKPTSVQQA